MEDVEAKLIELGIHLKPTFIDEIMRLLSTPTAPLEEQLQLLVTHFLASDLNICGSGCLPGNLQSEHNLILRGRHILQIDEAVDTAACAKQRYDGRGSRRCLKLSLTDGQRRVFAFEQTHIAALKTLCPAGLKVAITDAPIKRGMLVLQPENVSVMGGEVERLEQARQRMIERWRQPPTGSSGRNGAPVNLFAAASAAAWPEQGTDGIPGVPTQPPARAQMPHRQQAAEAAGPCSNPRLPPAHSAPPVPDNQIEGSVAPASRRAPARQHTRPSKSGQHAENALRQQSNSTEDEVMDLSDQHETPAASKSSFDSWDNQAIPLAEQGRHRPKRKARTQLIDDDEEELSSLSEQPPQARMRTSVAEQHDGDPEVHGVQGMPGPLTSLSQLAVLRDEEYPANIRMHGSIVGVVSNLHFIDKNGAALEDWTLSVSIEDSTSGNVQIAAFCDQLVQEILGLTCKEAYSLAMQGQVAMLKQKLSDFKQFLLEFAGFMVLEVTRAREEPLVLSLEARCAS